MLGDHNVLNTLAAIGVCLEMGIATDGTVHAVSQFKGLGRRFDKKGCVSDIIIDDYGHHPVEITAAAAGCQTKTSYHCCFPASPLRMRDLFDQFCMFQ